MLAVMVLAAMTAAAPSLLAQQSCACGGPIYPTRWSLFATVGGGMVETSGINALLAPNGFFAVSDDAVGFGVGGFSSFGPLRLGAEHVRLDAGEESTPAGLRANLEATYTMLVVGWDLRPMSRLSVAPSLGVGRGTFALTVGNRSGGATTPVSPVPTFAEVLAAPGTSSRIAGAHWVFEPMLAADLLVLRNAAHRRGVTLGARAGYRVAPNRAEWSYRGDRITGGPIDQAKGPIFRLTLGVGGR